MRRFAYILFSLLLAATTANAQNLTPVGVWKDASERIEVSITPCGDLLCGKLVWFKWPNDIQGLPVIDLKNKDPALRGRPLLGLTILRDLRRTDENTWEDGRIYDPNDGEDYRARMSIADDGTLRVRIYEIFPLFGETHTWTRIR
jgi:uncharacterized protein (DUF2147 family)